MKWSLDIPHPDVTVDAAGVPHGTPAWLRLSGSCCDTPDPDVEVIGCLNMPPEGIGQPPRRTSAASLVNQSGSSLYGQLWDTRTVTAVATVCGDGCPNCPDLTAKLATLNAALPLVCEPMWFRVVRECDPGTVPDCGDPEWLPNRYAPRLLYGWPVSVDMTAPSGPADCVDLVLRIDCAPLPVLADCDGNPDRCGTDLGIRLPDAACFDPVTGLVCFAEDVCFVPQAGPPPAETVCVEGTECVPGQVVFVGPLTQPCMVVTTDDAQRSDVGTVCYAGSVGPGQTVTVNTATGQATLDPSGTDVSGQTVVDPDGLTLAPGCYLTTLSAEGGSGTARICWRPVVTSVV